MLVKDIILYIREYIYFCIFQLIMSWILFDSLFGAQGRSLDVLETNRAPSFCRSEGAFLSVERKQVCLYIFYCFKVVF